MTEHGQGCPAGCWCRREQVHLKTIAQGYHGLLTVQMGAMVLLLDGLLRRKVTHSAVVEALCLLIGSVVGLVILSYCLLLAILGLAFGLLRDGLVALFVVLGVSRKSP